MSVQDTRGVEVQVPVRLPLAVDGNARQQMENVREALRLRHLARNQRHLQGFYYEHNLFDEAIGARCEMMQLLRTARCSWRLALGLMQ
jgi:hypothetical protein